MAEPKTSPAPWRGLAAGIAGGLVASLAMDLFQKVWSAVLPPPKTDGEPSTVRAAEAISGSIGATIDKSEKPVAGQVVHYAFGAVLGGAYGLIAEYAPRVTTGFGTVFGAANALLFDEGAVPAAGLSKPPTEFPPATHAYSLASHLLFGATTEGVRRSAKAAMAR